MLLLGVPDGGPSPLWFGLDASGVLEAGGRLGALMDQPRADCRGSDQSLRVKSVE